MTSLVWSIHRSVPIFAYIGAIFQSVFIWCVNVCRSGIDFVFQGFNQVPESPTPVYLSFLTILSEFSSKLLKPDKKTMWVHQDLNASFQKCWSVLSCCSRFCYLQKHTAEHIIDLREECWQPLGYYRASLLAVAEGEDAVSHASSDRKLQPNRSPFIKQKQEGTI